MMDNEITKTGMGHVKQDLMDDDEDLEFLLTVMESYWLILSMWAKYQILQILRHTILKSRKHFEISGVF